MTKLCIGLPKSKKKIIKGAKLVGIAFTAKHTKWFRIVIVCSEYTRCSAQAPQKIKTKQFFSL